MTNRSASEKSICAELLNRTMVGHLGLMDTAGYPRVIPLNFVFAKEHIYFHGGVHGEKYSLLQHSPKVTFNVDVPYAFIPSYWMNPERGCAVTQFFKSVLVRGQGHLIESLDEKEFALRALMEKYQPEGKYTPMIHTSQTYARAFEKVAVFCIVIENISVKYNFGQRWQPSKLNLIVHLLEERNNALDHTTVLEIEKSRSP